MNTERVDRHLEVTDRSASSRQLVERFCTTILYASTLRHCTVDCTVDWAKAFFYTRSCDAKASAPGATLDHLHRLASRLATSVFFRNFALIYSRVMTTSVLDAILVNGKFRSALYSFIVDESPVLWSRMRLRIMDDISCYELRITLTVTGTSVKFWVRSCLFLQSILGALFQWENASPAYARNI